MYSKEGSIKPWVKLLFGYSRSYLIGVLSKEGSQDCIRKRASYELLRLKYVKCLLAKDNITALFLLRNELNQYPEYFESEKKQLSQLFLCKSKKELVRKSGLDIDSQSFLEGFVKSLEARNMAEEGAQACDPFEDCVRRYLAFEVLDCPNHSSGSHELLQKESQINNNSNEQPMKEIGKVVNQKTKKISKKLNSSGENNTISRIRRTRRRHMCSTKTFKLAPKQNLKNPTNQVWRIKFSKEGNYIVACTKDNSLYCWKKK